MYVSMDIHIQGYTPRLLHSKEFKLCTGTSYVFPSFSVFLIDNLMKLGFLLEKKEKLNKLMVLTLSIGFPF